jgi:hypothetical protein
MPRRHKVLQRCNQVFGELFDLVGGAASEAVGQAAASAGLALA